MECAQKSNKSLSRKGSALSLGLSLALSPSLSLREWPCRPFSPQDFCSPCAFVYCRHNTGSCGPGSASILQHLFNVLPHWASHLAGLILPSLLFQGQEVDLVIRPTLHTPPCYSSQQNFTGRCLAHRQHHQGPLGLSCQN